MLIAGNLRLAGAGAVRMGPSRIGDVAGSAYSCPHEAR